MELRFFIYFLITRKMPPRSTTRTQHHNRVVTLLTKSWRGTSTKLWVKPDGWHLARGFTDACELQRNSHTQKPSSLPSFTEQKEGQVEIHHLFRSITFPSHPSLLHFLSASPQFPIFLSTPRHSPLLTAHPVSPSSPLVPHHPTPLCIFLCSASRGSPLKPHFHVQSILSSSTYFCSQLMPKPTLV